MITYDVPLYRPPSEANSVILQATIGCSFNACTFCGMYKDKTYRARPLAAISRDIAVAARSCPGARRVFLADGDALVLPTPDLLAITDALRAAFPSLERVSAYATPINLTQKSPEELRELAAAGLTLVYLGIESGSPEILKRIAKGATPGTIARGIDQARQAGLAVSATVILGLGGWRLWREHIDGTIGLINTSAPDYLSTLQLRLDERTRPHFLERFQRFGAPFEDQDDQGILEELARLLSGLAPRTPVVFRSNHASNCLPLAGTLPVDQERLLSLVAAARAGATSLRPAWRRGL